MQTRDIFLALLRAQFSGQGLTPADKELFAQATVEEWNEVITRCEMHKVQGILFRTWKQYQEIAVPPQVVNYLKQKANGISLRYYQMVSCVKQLLSMLDEQGISYYLLKGVGLSTMYPQEEMRSFGDVDLYIPRKEDLERTKKMLEDRQCEVIDTFSDCHTVYVFKGNGVACEVEVHWKLTANFNNGDIDAKLEQIYSEADGSEYITVYPLRTPVRILPPTMNALHLLSHMLQHFMSYGFGLKLFCDWTVFWQKYGKQVDEDLFLGWIHTLHIERFLYAVTGICVEYLGLSLEDCSWMNAFPQDKELVDGLLDDVWNGGEHGKFEEGRMLITSRAPGVKTYLLELHRQMKRRFKKGRDWVILWPLLWVLTGICFLYNNMTLRKISTKKIMDTNKRRNQLVQKLDMFEKK